MYSFVLAAHSWWRWVVIAAGCAALLAAWRGLRAGMPWEGAARRMGRLFGIAVDIQFLLGASLYLVFSPITNVALNVAEGLPEGSELRFFGVYHGLIMLGVFLDVHISAVLIRRAPSDRARFRRTLLLYGQVLLLLVGSIPWWRPWIHV